MGTRKSINHPTHTATRQALACDSHVFDTRRTGVCECQPPCVCVCTCTTCLCQIPALGLSANTQNKEERRTHCLCAHVWAAADKSALNTHTHTHTSLCGAYNVCVCVHSAEWRGIFDVCAPRQQMRVCACLRSCGWRRFCLLDGDTFGPALSVSPSVTPATRNAISSQRF